jgi:hypothetical protein
MDHLRSLRRLGEVNYEKERKGYLASNNYEQNRDLHNVI